MNNILMEKSGGICVLSFHRAEALNALNTEVLIELNAMIEMIAKDTQIDVVIITGKGKAFVAGADIAEMKEMDIHKARVFGEFGSGVFRKIELLEKPVIAAVNGFALGGGCELAMSCDVRIASTKAKFGQPEVGLGITPGFAGTQRMPRLVGVGNAKEMILTGKVIDAFEAEKIGLVNKVVEPEELMNTTMEMAKEIISKGQCAVRFSKAAINRGLESDIDTGMALEKELFALCFATEDQKEGMDAFVNRRAVEFQGR